MTTILTPFNVAGATRRFESDDELRKKFGSLNQFLAVESLAHEETEKRVMSCITGRVLNEDRAREVFTACPILQEEYLEVNDFLAHMRIKASGKYKELHR